MNKKIIWVKIITDNYYQVLFRLNSIGIVIYDNIIKDKYLLIKTNYEDYLRITKYLISYKVTIYKNVWIYLIKDIIKKYIVFIIGIIISVILLIVVNNLIFKIEVNSPKKEIQLLLKRELKKYNLDTLKLKKSHKKIEEIVEKILENNKDTLEWLEIKYDGLILVVNVTEKTKVKDEEVHEHCHIIATKDAKISSLNIYRGVALKEVNDYVNKGDIILSGDIMHNEEVKNLVCASGEVYGEVWYKVKVTIPLIENYIEYTGKNRYNFNIKINDNKYKILKSRIKNKKEEEISLYKLNDFEINLVKEKEYVTKVRELSEEEAYTKGINLALEKINLTLAEDEEIILKKVLKNTVNDSTIYLEVFIVTKENIGYVLVL